MMAAGPHLTPPPMNIHLQLQIEMRIETRERCKCILTHTLWMPRKRLVPHHMQVHSSKCAERCNLIGHVYRMHVNTLGSEGIWGICSQRVGAFQTLRSPYHSEARPPPSFGVQGEQGKCSLQSAFANRAFNQKYLLQHFCSTSFCLNQKASPHNQKAMLSYILNC